MNNEGSPGENQGLIPKSPPRPRVKLLVDEDPPQPDTSLFGLMWNSLSGCMGMLVSAFGWRDTYQTYGYSEVASPKSHADLQLELDDLDAYDDADLDDFDNASMSCIDEGRDRTETNYRLYDAKPLNVEHETPGRSSSSAKAVF